jgi:predicted phosphodiesterase
MRVAVIADIHGNLTALEAVLADLAATQVDEIVCLGDVAATGPQPYETVAQLRALACPVVMGNAPSLFTLDSTPGGVL